jgi:hypothetical protein
VYGLDPREKFRGQRRSGSAEFRQPGASYGDKLTALDAHPTSGLSPRVITRRVRWIISIGSERKDSIAATRVRDYWLKVHLFSVKRLGVLHPHPALIRG